ncbi:Plant self-incompatibility protein S1 family [Striga hermonthica]|uniref:S-protein homolog n=1 Tax=Striga hermonthica TaxID=68872 RepID=A0A9N7RDF1_STRHE|nr:Plant self-incompatibility protein S1 family [Striga hermonthica]
MACSNLRNTILFLFIIASVIHAPFASSIKIKKKCFLTSKVTVHVANLLSVNEPFLLHCRSKDDDLGIKTMDQNQEFRWTFCTNIWYSTKFWCTFQWGLKHQVIIAYEEAKREYCNDNHCYWSARDDRIYFSDTKYYDWIIG